MNKMTKRLLACCCILPLYGNACDESGDAIWVNLQLIAGKQPPVEWPLLPGYIKGSTICVDKKRLPPVALPMEALPMYVQPRSDLIITVNHASQSISARWQLDVNAVAGLPAAQDSKAYLPACVVQQLGFVAETSAHNAGRYSINTQAKIPALGECQGVDVVRDTVVAMPVQWTLSAAFLLSGEMQKSAGVTSRQAPANEIQVQEIQPQIIPVQETKKDEPSKLQQFLDLPSADADAKKRMKKH